MIDLLITLAILASYPLIGFAIATYSLPKLWVAARRANRYDDLARESVYFRFVFTWLLWPLVLPAMRLVGVVRAKVEAADPHEHERRLTERERTLRNLERELGIGRS